MNAKLPVLPTAESFKWPAPPYFDYFPVPDDKAPEPCLVVLAGGHKLQGELLRFDPDAAVFELGIPGGSAGPLPAYADMVQLRLLRPLRLKRQELPYEIGAADTFPASEWQPYTIETHGGDVLSGETHGHVGAQCGTFLFPREGTDQITRCFVPAREIKAFRVGDPIGQILVEQHVVSKAAVDAALARQRELRFQKLGDLLTENQIVSADELAAALKLQQQKPILRLGEVLTNLGLVTPAELASALSQQERNRKVPLGQILIDMGVVDQDVIKTVMAKKLGIPFVNLRKFRILTDVIKKVPASLAQRHTVIPVYQTENLLVVAVENPLATKMLEELRFATGMTIQAVMAAEDDIRAAIQKHYVSSSDPMEGALEIDAMADRKKDDLAYYNAAAGDSPIDSLASKLDKEGGELELTDEQVNESDTTLVKLINKMIMDAHQQKASDIHIETYPGKKKTRIRFRKDGVLKRYLELPSKFRSAMVSRIKIMATLDISERRKPQDGKIDFSRFGPARLELRVATIPTANGLEDVVMRLLAAATPLPLEKLGFSEAVLRNVQAMVKKPHGLCLVCGPTGSGKTTTLHSLLGFINTEARKIWTAEDPIEITQEGLRQVQVNSKIGWTFAAAMRSFLRADPDVIMVGEMRDAETTKTGIEASLTGHLVLSTLHTNSAPESVVRLLDMGMDPFNFADALLGILAQRLARRLCPSCRQAYVPEPAELQELLAEYCRDGGLDPVREMAKWRETYADSQGSFTLFRAPGCEECSRTGYQGRIGLYELLVADATVKRLIQTRATVTEIRDAAVASGMRTLKQNGIERILEGLTDLTQVRAVSG